MKRLGILVAALAVLAAAGRSSKQFGQPVPTGKCWWCGKQVGRKSFFCPGHDKSVESAIVKMRHGGVAQLMIDYGYGPGGTDLRAEYEQWEREQNGKKPSP